MTRSRESAERGTDAQGRGSGERHVAATPRVARRGVDPSVRERWALVILAAVAGARAMVSIAPALRFDSDPAIVPGAFAGIGPGGSLLLDALGAAAIALLGVARWRASRTDRTRAGGSLLALLSLVPLPAFLVVALAPDGSFADFWRGSTWLIAALGAGVVAGADGRGRAIVVAALLGIAAALLVRGASQVLSEHAAMIEEYERSPETFLASRGWTKGSAAALAYERRLRQPEASGWFGLANVYSGVLVATALACAGIAIGAHRGGGAGRGPGAHAGANPGARAAARPAPGARASEPARPSSRSVGLGGLACAVMALGSIALVLVNGSKGAFAALGIGGAALVVVGVGAARAATRARSGSFARWMPWLLLLLVALGPVVAFVRGAILGETSLGERSMLFRWHYLIGALRIFVEAPLAGIGAGGFQDAYTRLRPWMSPEEVVSAHGAFLDWLAAFGVSALALVALALALLRRALVGACAPVLVPPPAVDSAARPRAGGCAAISVVLAGLLVIGLTSPSDLSNDSVLVRVIAITVGAIVAALAAGALDPGDPAGHGDALEPRGVSPWAVAGVSVGALALFIHGQVDMEFWLPGSAWWCWLLLGAAAAAGPLRPRRFDRTALVIIVLAAVAGGAARGILAVRAGVQERALERIARQIERAADTDQPLPRLEAARELERVTEVIPGNVVVWQAAVEQAIRALEGTPRELRDERQARAEEALELAERAYRARPELLTARLRADARFLDAIERRRAPDGSIATGPAPGRTRPPEVDLARDDALIQAIDETLRRDPRSLAGWRRKVEALMLLGDPVRAAAAAREGLRVNASYALDPLRQLSDRERATLERIAGGAPATSSAGASTAPAAPTGASPTSSPPSATSPPR